MPISWFTKKQNTVSKSTTKTEYRSLAQTASELYWIRQLLCNLYVFLSRAPLLWCDNASDLTLASNPVFHARTKHIEIDYYFYGKKSFVVTWKFVLPHLHLNLLTYLLNLLVVHCFNNFVANF